MPYPAPLLALVVPCYNEAPTLPRTLDALSALLHTLKQEGRIAEQSCALYVDDGSSDATWELIQARHAEDSFCKGVKFAGNAGHQLAVLAGMHAAQDWGADCVISLDADLQDDITIIPQMLDHYRAGHDIVFGVRDDRSSDTPFKRTTARAFYGVMRLLRVNLIPDHADFRLVSRPVLDALQNFSEQRPFLRGIFPSMGFSTARVTYRRLAREAGQTKYPVWKMLSFAWRGILSFSAAPLRLAGLFSLVGMVCALALAFKAICDYATGTVVSGWTSLMIAVLFMGSVQLFCLAVMGEYIARIFEESKGRPRYIVEKMLL